MKKRLVSFTMALAMVFGTAVSPLENNVFIPASAEDTAEPELVIDSSSSNVSKLIPPKGKSAVVCLMVEFPDSPHDSSLTVSSVQKKLDYVHNFYQRVSYGNLDLQMSVAGDWYTAKHEREYYEDLAEEKGEGYSKAILLREVIESLDDSVDFSQYDLNGDGFIDETYMVCSGSKGVYSGYWWPCAMTCVYDIEADGVKPGEYAWLTGIEDDTGVIAHETGHALGLDDIYDTEMSGRETFSVSDMMKDNEWEFNAFSKIQLGWIDPVIVSSDSTITLKSSGAEPEAVIVYPKGNEKSDQFFVLEYLNYRTWGSFFNYRVPNGGLRIWRVNARAYGNTYGRTPAIENVDWQNYRGKVIYDQGQDNHTAIWSGDRDFTPYSYPSSYFYKSLDISDGVEFSGISIKDISADGETLTCKVSYEDTPSDNTFSYTSKYEIGGFIFGELTFPVETFKMGDDVKLTDENGTELPLDWFIDSLPEDQAYTKLKYNADISSSSSSKFYLTIKGGTLKNSYGVENDDISIEITDKADVSAESTKINGSISNISEIVTLNGEMYYFKLIDDKVTMLRIDKDGSVLGSTPLFDSPYDSCHYCASVYKSSKIILQIETGGTLYVYTVSKDGSYKLISSFTSGRVPVSALCGDKVVVFKSNDTSTFYFDICLLDVESGEYKTIITDLFSVEEFLNVSEDHLCVFHYTGSENSLTLYNSSGTKTGYVDLSNSPGAYDPTENFTDIFELDGQTALISRIDEPLGDSKIVCTVVDDELNVLKRKTLYTTSRKTFSNDVCVLDDGFMLPLNTTYKMISIDGAGWSTGFATAAFFDKDMNYRFQRIIDRENVFENVKNAFSLDDDEYIVATEFDCVHLTVNSVEKPCEHDYVATVFKSTDTKPAYTHYKCSVCGDEYDDFADQSVEETVDITLKAPKGSALSAETSLITIGDDKFSSVDGQVNIPELDDGDYQMTISAPNYVARTYSVTVSKGKIVEDIQPELHLIGDVTGDGQLNASDLLKAKSHIKNVSKLKGYDFDCANIDGTSGNKVVNASDLLKMKAHIKGVNKLW